MREFRKHGYVPVVVSGRGGKVDKSGVANIANAHVAHREVIVR